jgi:hypothetical protein
MPDREQSTPPTAPLLDLTRYTEATRRALYDRIAVEHFSPTNEEMREAISSETWLDLRSAEDAGLTLHFVYGRWVAVWAMAEPVDATVEADRWDVNRVTQHADGSISFSEC